MYVGGHSRHPSGPLRSPPAPGRRYFGDALSPKAGAHRPPTPAPGKPTRGPFRPSPSDRAERKAAVRCEARAEPKRPPGHRVRLRWGRRTRGSSENPEERLLQGGSRAHERMRVSTKHLVAPSTESSRKSCHLRNQKSPSRRPWRATVLARLGRPRPHTGGASGGASPLTPAAGPDAPGAQLHPPPPRLSSGRPCPRSPNSALGPAPPGLSALPAAPRRRGPEGPRRPRSSTGRATPLTEPPTVTSHAPLLPPNSRTPALAPPLPPQPETGSACSAGLSPNRSEAPKAPPTAAFNPAPRRQAEAPTPWTGKEAAPWACREAGRGLGGNTTGPFL